MQFRTYLKTFGHPDAFNWICVTNWQAFFFFSSANRSCPADQFKCLNNRCIPKRWLCDGTDDCGSNEDESNRTCSGEFHSGALSYMKGPVYTPNQPKQPRQPAPPLGDTLIAVGAARSKLAPMEKMLLWEERRSLTWHPCIISRRYRHQVTCSLRCASEMKLGLPS